MVINKGPQIHFWISEKAESETETKKNKTDKKNCPQLDDCYPQADRKNDQSLPPYYHVEIF